jgi:hypothetical protein
VPATSTPAWRAGHMTDGRCRFGPRAKREMVEGVLGGESARSVARSMRCSPSTVTLALERWEQASAASA